MFATPPEPDDRLLTIREYAQLPEDELYRDELVRGRVVREPRPKPLHGWIVVRLVYFVMQHVEPRGLGVVISEAGVVTERDPPTVRGPDLTFVTAERAPSYPANDFMHTPPDLVAEVLSPSDRRGRIAGKVAEYLTAGVRVVWVVDPKRRQVTVHRPGAEPTHLEGDDVLSGDDVLPGFALPLTRLFG